MASTCGIQNGLSPQEACNTLLLNVVATSVRDVYKVIQFAQESTQGNMLKLISSIDVLTKKIEANATEIINLKKSMEKQVVYKNGLLKAKNLVLFGLTESASLSNDELDIKDIIRGIDVPVNTVISFRRLGRKADKCRPVLLTFDNENSATNALRNRFKLPNGVYLSRDKTKMQRELYKKLKQEVDEHNARNFQVRQVIRFNQGNPYVVSLSLSSPPKTAPQQNDCEKVLSDSIVSSFSKPISIIQDPDHNLNEQIIQSTNVTYNNKSMFLKSKNCNTLEVASDESILESTDSDEDTKKNKLAQHSKKKFRKSLKKKKKKKKF